MDQQELLEQLDVQIAIRDGLCNLLTTSQDYFNHPRSKLEIINYCTEKNLEKIFSSKIVKNLYLELLNPSCGYNSDIAKRRLITSPNGPVAIIAEFSKGYRAFINSLYDYLLDISVQIEKLTYDDLVDRNIALRRAVLKLTNLFFTSITAPLTVDQLRELPIGEISADDYMLGSVEDLINRKRSAALCLNDECLMGYRVMELDGYGVGENMTSTLRSFIEYVSTFVRY